MQYGAFGVDTLVGERNCCVQVPLELATPGALGVAAGVLDVGAGAILGVFAPAAVVANVVVVVVAAVAAPVRNTVVGATLLLGDDAFVRPVADAAGLRSAEDVVRPIGLAEIVDQAKDPHSMAG